ncbi:MAG TPA: histidine kinase [Kofleriaceae bacterium]|nr:histidine kinase [Kofleriaceae bacterium]
MSRSRLLWIAAAVWAVPMLLATLQSYYYSAGGAAALLHGFVREGLVWATWIPVTPMIVRGAEITAPRGSWFVRHLVRAVGMTLLFGIVSGILMDLTRHAGDPPGVLGEINMGIVDWLPLQPLIYAGVLATGVALDAARRRRDAELSRAQLETQLAHAQLSALRAQLQPHFLFNTLNAAVALARAGNTDATARVLILLGDLLRQLLRSDAPQEIPLREELALLETYLEIQRVRLGDRLHVTWDIDDGVRDALVPQLVLQPLVENALQHGISRRTRAGRLEITAARHGDQLRLTVSDDGPGLPPSFSLADATGVGLRNTRERLHRLYGERGDLELATADGRTTASIELPIRDASDAAADDAEAEAAGD